MRSSNGSAEAWSTWRSSATGWWSRPTSTAPRPPFTETLDRHGFAVSGAVVASSREELERQEREQLTTDLRQEFELSRSEPQHVAEVVSLVRSQTPVEPGHFVEGEQEASDARLDQLLGRLTERGLSPATIRSWLRDPWLAETVARVALDVTAPAGVGLAELGALLSPPDRTSATRQERASLEYLRGRCLEFAGEPLGAESAFKDALALAPDHAGAVIGLAGIAVDRGEFEAALSMLDRVGAAPQHALRSAIEAAADSASPPRQLPGRNEPCWCGSGRKFKACHAHATGPPLRDRMNSLSGRVVAWELLNDRSLLSGMVRRAVIVGGPDAVTQMIPLLTDLIVMEGGGLADYLDRRGALLPADEVMTAQQWLLRPRSVSTSSRCVPVRAWHCGTLSPATGTTCGSGPRPTR
jgi:SEC-C motif/Tetratricopeptide repeat